MFKSAATLLIDADRLGHEILSRRSVRAKVLKLFGAKILKSDNSIDRRKLGRIVFGKKSALSGLNLIMYPELARLIRRRIASTSKRIIILDAALIIEAGLTGLVDKLVVVTAGKSQKLARTRKKLGLSEREAILMMKSQISQKQKERFADFIIDNSANLSKTKKQVSQIRRQLWKS